MQTGLKIRELPMVVQKVNDVLKIEELNQIGNNGSKSSSCDIADTAVTHTVTLPSANDREIMEGFNRIVSVSGLFKLLETLPAQKVTPTVAVHCLKRIIHLNNTRRRNNFEIDVSLSTYIYRIMIVISVFKCHLLEIVIKGIDVWSWLER